MAQDNPGKRFSPSPGCVVLDVIPKPAKKNSRESGSFAEAIDADF